MILSPNVLDEFTHECLAIRVARKLKAIDVIDVLSDLFILRGMSGSRELAAARLRPVGARWSSSWSASGDAGAKE